MKYTIFIFLILVTSSCDTSFKIDNNFFVQKEEISGGFILSYNKEGVLHGEYIYEIGSDIEYIIAKTSKVLDAQQIKSYNYYIIDKNEYIRLWGKVPRGGILGPYKLDAFTQKLIELKKNNLLEFTRKF